jgi:hypothetical protein
MIVCGDSIKKNTIGISPDRHAHAKLAVSDMGTTTNTHQDTHVPLRR